MKTKNSYKFTSILIVAYAALLVGCGSKEHENNKYELSPATKEGGVYRLNKQSGEVLFIVAQTSMIVQGTGAPEATQAITNRLVNWGEIALAETGDIKVKLKTNWRDGKLYYRFSASSVEHLSSIMRTAPNAQFTISFYDEEGFRTFGFRANLAEFSLSPTSGDRVDSMEMNDSVPCELEVCKDFKSWAVSRTGF